MRRLDTMSSTNIISSEHPRNKTAAAAAAAAATAAAVAADAAMSS